LGIYKKNIIMRGYFGLGQLSPSEKSDILDQHKQIYDGYKTMLPQVSNTQPLYTQDYANDKNGITVNNKGVVKRYTNVGINEQVEESKEVCDECGAMGMSEEKEMCSECGGMMQEGECSECGWKGEVGAMEEETGHLDDIYNEVDLDPNAEFDYVKGASNKTNAFHVKEQAEDYINYKDNFEDPDNEDDGFEDINASEVTDEIEEQGYTGGGNAPDMDLSNIDYAYNFQTDGPKKGNGPYIDKANDMDLDDSKVWDAYDFETGGATAGGDAFPQYEEEMDEEWEQMESAWAEEIDEIDVSGAQGIYGDMEPAFDFDSGGPGKAGPYQRSSWSEGSVDDKKIEHGYEGEDEDAYWEKDLADDELDLDLTKFNPEDKSWEEISDYTGDDEFSYVDEDIRESVVNQKNKIMEMMNRMKIIK